MIRGVFPSIQAGLSVPIGDAPDPCSQFETVPFPIGGVVSDILGNTFVFGVIADDAVPIIALPPFDRLRVNTGVPRGINPSRMACRVTAALNVCMMWPNEFGTMMAIGGRRGMSGTSGGGGWIVGR